MDEHASKALHYGHVGRAIYSTETSSWSFSRSFARFSSLVYTGVTTTSIEGSPDTKAQGDHLTESTSRSLIPQAYPDLGAVWPSVKEDVFSKFLTSATELYDPNVSTLLDLGYALHLGHNDAKVRPSPLMIAAAVTGTCRNVITFRVLAEGAAELTQEGSVVRVPSIDDAETTEWSSQGAPIRQICFSRPTEDDEERLTWMAARLSESTAIFRPFYQQDPVPMHLRRDDPWALPTLPRNSRLDANPVVEILSTYTGGFPHADVAFNPWYQRQLAIVDNRGNWSIWEITGRQKRRKAHWLAAPGQQGSLPLDDDLKANHPRHDGWASIQWIADYSVIMVADRRCVMLFRIDTNDIRSTVVEINMGRKSEWILDIQRSTRNLSQFSIVTTSRILWFDLTGVALDGEAFRLPVRPRLTWCHFRDSEDISLKCHDLLLGGVLHIVLYSRLADLVQVFPCPLSTDEQDESTADSIAVADPFLLEVPCATDASNLSKPTRFSTFVFREVAHSPISQGKTQYNPNMTLIKLFWIDSSLAVHETLFKGPDREEQYEETDTQDNNVLRVKKHHSAPTKDVEIREDDDFIVDDWDESVFGPNQAPIPRASRISPYAGLEWTVNWSQVYKLVLKRMLTPANEAWLDQVMDILGANDDKTRAPGNRGETLLDIGGDQHASSDIDQCAQDLESLTLAIASEPPNGSPREFMIMPLRFSLLFSGIRITSGQDPSKLDLLKTYDGLVQEWVASLPSNIPNGVRVMKEKMIRRIALELLLSRIVRISDRATKNRQEIATSQEPASSMQSSQLPSSQSTPLGSAKPRKNPVFSYSSLSTFTHFKRPRHMPVNVGSLLAQWEPGANPSGYDWQKSSLLVDEDTQRASRSHRRERKKRSQQSSAPDAVVLPPTPVAPLIRAWGSQPDQAPAFLQSSQPTVDEAPMTQMERGQFGTRDTTKSAKPKKKRRAAGF